jgi:regulator of extracellular matrix RemA (YlzA/DUF370 family)
MKLISVGFGNYVAIARIVSIVAPDSAPIKRAIQNARERSTLIDATCGRRTRAVIMTDSGHVVLTAVHPETIAQRMDERDDGGEEEGVE